MPRILVADPIDDAGIELLQAKAEVDVKTGLKPPELVSIIGHYDALVVRSETRVTGEVLKAGRRLQVVGRAGVGVDNIDLEAATQRGIAVVNAPTGNIIAAAEHTIALMLSLSRNVPQANASLKQGQWRRSAFMGVEIRGKTLGIVGLGRVGSEVARRAQGFQMRLLSYDPFISQDYASNLGVELVPYNTLLTESDFITLHTPLSDSTQKLIGPNELRLMKPSMRIINTARGGLIDEDALFEAMQEGHIGGAALDVFSKEPPEHHPLFDSEKVIVTPHLGASTTEAQREAAREVADQVLAVLQGKPAQYTVNAPFVLPEVQAVIAPYTQVASYAGKLATQLAGGQLEAITVRYEGEIAQYDTTILKTAALVGLLSPVTDERVNMVNANLVATQRGLRVSEHKSTVSNGQYGSLVTVELNTTEGTTAVAGTSMRGEPHLVRINEYWLDVVPSGGYMLSIHHQDRPGLIGAVGTITGQHDINISFMEVGRLAPRGRAMMLFGLDDPIPDHVLEEIRAIPHIFSAKVVVL